MELQYIEDTFRKTALAVTMRKAGFAFLGLAATVAKAILPLAGLFGVSKGLTEEGSVKDKIMAGVQEAGNQLINPANLFSNIAVWGAPGWALKGTKLPGIVQMPLGLYGGMKASEVAAPILNLPGEEEDDSTENPFDL